ncbi:hypothetical protein [Streptomyces sp. NBC_00826]|uniref:hypothetical protein n=1 Tax=Streptomyces sp. NBC_00826 TaxID=2975845 RepID=UPI00386A7231|nr:hypothetical protein OG832_01000 [Streptomyces sp. NBC_00826]
MARQAVRDIRTAPPPPPADPPTDPTVAALRCVVDDLAASTHAIGELMLEVAPAYLSDTAAADVLALLCEEIGEPLDHGLAARRYALFRRPPRPAPCCRPPTPALLCGTQPVSPGERVRCKGVSWEMKACGSVPGSLTCGLGHLANDLDSLQVSAT